MRGTLSAIDHGCLMTALTYFAQQSCAFTLQFQLRDQAKCRDRVISKAPTPAVQFMNFSALPLSFPSAPGSTTILLSPRECQESLLLLFTGYSITLSTSGRVIFLEIHSPESPLAPYMQGIYHMKIWNCLPRLFYWSCPRAGTGKTL